MKDLFIGTPAESTGIIQGRRLTMFRSTDFYDHLTSHIVSPWWLYLIMGVNFLLLAVLVLTL